jgi:hypothetical protein
VTLDHKGEVVKYCDDADVYYFSLPLKKWKWISNNSNSSL